MKMVQVSLAGFAAGGAFLSLVHFDLPYYIVTYVILVDATLREREIANQSSPLPTTNAVTSISPLTRQKI